MEAPEFILRPLEDDDLEEWFRLRRLLWDATTDEDHKSEMLEIFEHQDTQLVLVVQGPDGRLAGFLEASLRPFVEDCDTDHVGYLEGWFVDEKYRRRGLGRGLVEAAEKWARSRGCTEMASDAEIGNEKSLVAHTRLGYQETSRLVHLRKELT